MIAVRRLGDEEFSSMRDEWNGLLGRSPADGPFLRWEWARTWWDVFKRGRRLFLLEARLGARLVGIAPLYIEGGVLPGARRLRFCSEELGPDYLDIIAENGLEKEVAGGFVRCLRRHPDEWDVLRCDSLRPRPTLLADPAAFGGMRLAVADSHECPYVAVRGSFDDYLGTRTELARRFALEKKARRLFGMDGAAFTAAADAASLSDGLDVLFALHKKRADSLRMRSEFQGPGIERFHRRLAALFLEQGFLRLQVLRLGGVPLAARYGFGYKGKRYMFQGGMDPAHKRHSPGMVTVYLVLRDAFARGLRECDFLKGSEPYKGLWANGARRQVSVTAYSPGWGGALRRSADGLRRALGRARRAWA